MAMRYLKILLIAAVSLVCLLYAIQNLVNLGAAYAFVESAMGMDGHAAYPDALGPAVTAPVLLWAALFVIIGLETLAGLLAARGAWHMWIARNSTAAQFHASKKAAVLACGVAFAVWFGLFTSVGGAYFQMWQTDLGAASLQGAFQISLSIGVAALFVHMEDH